jgi:hypothetical protein
LFCAGLHLEGVFPDQPANPLEITSFVSPKIAIAGPRRNDAGFGPFVGSS